MMKMKNLKYLRNSARQGDFNEIFDPQGIPRVNQQFFSKNRLPTIFGRHREFLCKIQKHISETV